MKKIKRILFPTDFSVTARHAFHYAVMMACKLNTSILVLHVMQPDYDSGKLPITVAVTMKNKTELLKSQINAFVKTSLGDTRFNGMEIPEIETKLDMGNVALRILLTSSTDNIDLIVMGTKGEHPVIEKIFGSVSSEIAKKAQCHVLLVPEKAELAKINTVGFATDLSTTDPYHLWKVGKLFDVFHPILRCVHVHKSGEKGHELDFTDLEEFFEDHPPLLQLSFHEVQGSIVIDCLSEFVETWDIDLLVMYAPYRAVFERFFHESQTQKMAFHSTVPLFILKDMV